MINLKDLRYTTTTILKLYDRKKSDKNQYLTSDIHTIDLHTIT